MTHQKKQDASAYIPSPKHFYQHLTSYILLNIVLIIINLATDPHRLWFYWLSLLWGIVIFLQAIYTLGRKYRTKKQQKNPK